jgi:hypothetical protein
MIGNLLLASRSVSFFYNRAAGQINVATPGSTTAVSSIIAENNSPLPWDRVYFRYNHFDNAQSVTGFGPTVFDARGVGTALLQTRNFDLDRFTFGFEKTFLDQRASVELRVPFNTTLGSSLDLSAGTVIGPPAPGGLLPVTATPENTLGNSDTQFENLNLIFKGLLYRSDALAVSAGLGVEIPTGNDTHVRVTDFSGPVTTGAATIERVRDFRIDNETWALSPFVAVLATPTDRLFTQGFLQFDFPLNDSTINYSETLPFGSITPPQAAFAGGVAPPFSVRDHIAEQTLMHIDWGAGYWVVRDPDRRCLTGLAPSLELHYTTTLNNAPIVDLPADGLLRINPTPPPGLIPEPGPRVGNLRNRMDILDLTFGATFLFSDRATLAAGFSFPLRGSQDRTYEWEAHVQLNYYFGGLRSRAAPNF